jgi:hypothetical protein
VIGFLKKYYPLLAIALAVGGSLVTIALRRAEEAPPGAIVLRIGHWQLEASVRDAINIMAEDYRKLHPECPHRAGRHSGNGVRPVDHHPAHGRHRARPAGGGPGRAAASPVAAILQPLLPHPDAVCQ